MPAAKSIREGAAVENADVLPTRLTRLTARLAVHALDISKFTFSCSQKHEDQTF